MDWEVTAATIDSCTVDGVKAGRDCEAVRVTIIVVRHSVPVNEEAVKTCIGRPGLGARTRRFIRSRFIRSIPGAPKK